VAFKGLSVPVNPLLDSDDQRLKTGVTEFEYVFSEGRIDPGQRRKCELGLISSEFLGWRQQEAHALQKLRQEDRADPFNLKTAAKFDQ
jgi:hypothetical protein